MYFGQKTEDAIVKYNHSEDTYFRHKIYTEEIHAAFMKLAENIINTYKFCDILFQPPRLLVATAPASGVLGPEVQGRLVVALEPK